MKIPYSEGSTFLVPLAKGGFARGVVARVSPGGVILLGYFFGPRIEADADSKLDELRPGGKVLSMRFGDLGLIKEYWQILSEI